MKIQIIDGAKILGEIEVSAPANTPIPVPVYKPYIMENVPNWLISPYSYSNEVSYFVLPMDANQKLYNTRLDGVEHEKQFVLTARATNKIVTLSVFGGSQRNGILRSVLSG